MIRPTMATAMAPPQTDVVGYARAARRARFLAIVADTFFFGLVTLLVNGLFGVTVVTSGAPLIVGPGTATFSTTAAVDWPWLAALSFAYFTLPESVFGATPGKALAGLRVVRTDGGPLGIGAVVLRNLLRPIDYLPVFYMVGGALVLATRQSRRLGDMAAGTTVVSCAHADALGLTRRPRTAAITVLALLVAVAVAYSAFFAYFGRPALIVAGDFNTRSGVMRNAIAYRLGTPAWEPGRVTYPLTVTVRIGGPTGQFRVCHGSIEMNWYWLGGWSEGSAGYICAS